MTERVGEEHISESPKTREKNRHVGFFKHTKMDRKTKWEGNNYK